MKKILLATVAIVAFATPSLAGSSLGVGFNLGNAAVQSGTLTFGNAAAGAVGTSTNQSIGAGIAARTPLGSTSAGIGVSAGQSNAAAGAFSIGNGAALSGVNSTNGGIGVGIGATSRFPR